MLKSILKRFIFLFLLTQITYNKDIKIEEKRLRTVLIKYFSSKDMPELLGSQVYKNKNGYTFQIDINNKDLDINNVIYLCFSSLNKISSISNKPITELIVIIHFEKNNIPIVIKAENDCLNRFFKNSLKTKLDWKNNCLNIGTF